MCGGEGGGEERVCKCMRGEKECVGGRGGSGGRECVGGGK